MKTTYFENDDVRDTAFGTIRKNAYYQASLLLGDATWSGSSLKGKAKDYGASYHESRVNLIGKLRQAGLDVWIGHLPSQGRTHVALIYRSKP